MPNRLASETSPYLLQHADNPVDWYPWGNEALEKARAEDKPVFLSIGYSACHWCHVMAHESFEDGEVAAILGEHFVSVKVDREERPDLDRIYMRAVQVMTGSGGWPMSVFLTPEGLPFYGGTYFPPTPRYGLPSFKQVLQAVRLAWQTRRQELVEGGRQVVAAIEQHMDAGQGQGEACRPETLREAFQNLLEQFDPLHGGWGRGPKFPQPVALEFLLRHYHGMGNREALGMVARTLEAMARGGIYDQLGGGFHRYSVDGRWLVPHFERMLYDNAQLSRVYLHAWQVTGNRFFRAVTEEILDYVVREMTGPQGGFYSSQDADSEGEEGRFFLWTPAEIRSALGGQAEAFMAAYGVTEGGNFAGRNVLRLAGSLEEREALAPARQRLFAVREQRVHPGQDDKVLTSWNGLMLGAFAEAARALGREDYRHIAVRSADFLLRELWREDGRLWHVWRGQDAGSKVDGYLEDHACLVDGLLELYQTTFEPRWYTAAQDLAEAMIAHFRHPESGFYDTSDDHEGLVLRPRELQDNALPSGNAMAACVLQRLGALAARPDYRELAERGLQPLQLAMARYPLAFGQWLIAQAYLLAPPREVAIVGDLAAEDTRALVEAATPGYRPHQVVALGCPDAPSSAIPLLHGRACFQGQATAYICVGSTCLPPVTSPADLL